MCWTSDRIGEISDSENAEDRKTTKLGNDIGADENVADHDYPIVARREKSDRPRLLRQSNRIRDDVVEGIKPEPERRHSGVTFRIESGRATGNVAKGEPVEEFVGIGSAQAREARSADEINFRASN